MKLENQVLIVLESENLFNKPAKFAINKISNLTGAKSKDVEKALKNLHKDKHITFENNYIKKPVFVSVETQTDEAEQIDLTQLHIATLVEREGTVFAKLRGINLPPCEIEQTETAKRSVGKTCLVKVKNDGNIPYADVHEIFGFSDDPISENVAIATKYGFSTKFPEDVLADAAKIPQYVTAEQKRDRKNLTHIPFVTIDPEGCKDKDDAIFDEPIKDGFKVYIAIADVSSGVSAGTVLDKEAFKRGNSAYLGGGVYPMLPPELSNGIFSLDEGKERLALVASANINYDGKISEPKVECAVIKVKKSYSYQEAEKTYLNEDGLDKVNAGTKKTVDTLYKNTKLLEEMLSKMMEFDSHEPAYRFSNDGKDVEDIVLSNKEYSHKVVETRMILANEIVAQFFRERSLTGLFRTHEGARADKLVALKKKLNAFGIKYKLENTTESFNGLLEVIKQSPARDYLMAETIRTLSRAKYVATDSEIAHFGLGITNADSGYMHFTSPIRRYSDLLTHRMLKEILLGKVPSLSPYTLSLVAEHLNLQEKKADKAEAESDAYLACLWAKKHEGEIQKGYISQIGKDYIKVMTADGTVPVLLLTEKLKNYKYENYKIFPTGMKLVGKTITYALGDNIEFEISDVDFAGGTIFGSCEQKKENFTENQVFLSKNQ